VSAWQDLVTASLLGTERAAVPAVPVPCAPGRAGAPDGQAPGIAADPAALLLDQAALLTAARRGGRRQERAKPLAAAAPDTVPCVSRAAGRRLAAMLGGEHPDLLAEWLAAAAGRGRRVPASLLPGLLDRVRRGSSADPELCRLVAEAGGPRARWLAGLNPEWKLVLSYAPAGEDAWRLGNTAQRRGYLSGLRARDPGAARDLVAASWDAAGPDERVMFVSVIATGLSLADEPLLEAALDDRHAWVRKAAADLLAALPGSALSGRMAERARHRLRRPRGTGGGLLVSPPGTCDAAMRRDGITPPDTNGPPLAGQAMLLLGLVARTPLRTWTDRFGLTPAEIAGLDAGDWTPVLHAGWARAAITQSRYDPSAGEWMAVLIERPLRLRLYSRSGTAAEILGQLARRAGPALGAPGALPEPRPDDPPFLHDAVRVLRFRYQMLKELDDDSAG
jgi:hypothetical protein